MINKKILGYSLAEKFLICAYLICWTSISTSFQDIIDLYKHELLNINNVVNFTRQFLNILLFPILLVLFFKNYKNIFFSNEIIFIFSFFYFLSQLPGLFLTENSLMNLCYIISAFNILLIFILANIYFEKKNYIIFIKLTLLMLLIITIFNYKTIVNFFTVEGGNVLYTYFYASETFFGKESPRSTGSSRTFLFILIISLIIFKKFFNINYKTKNIFYILIISLVILFQSRTTIILMLFFLFLDFLFEKNFSFKAWTKFVIISFVLPIILIYSILITKNFFYDKEFFNEFKKENFSVKKKLIQINKNSIRPIDPNTFSSGRLNDWKLILSKIDGSIIYGYGSQGDRHTIQQSASNGIFYALSSSGIMGIFFFIFLSLIYFFIICKKFLLSFKNNDTEKFYSSIVILLILLRSLLESSYAVFGVDFIIIYTFVNFLNINNFGSKK